VFIVNEMHVLQTWCKSTLNFHKLKRLDPFTKNVFLPELFLFTITGDAAAGFGDLQLKVK